MKHAAIHDLYEYWDKLRGSGLAPERDAIEPGSIRRVLPDMFILKYDPGMGHPIRLAGTRTCALFGRELKAEPFLKLWDKGSRSQVRDLFSVVSGEGVAVVAGAVGHTLDGKSVEVEMLVLPLALGGRLDARVLGAMLPTLPPYWLGVDPVNHLVLGALRYVSEPREQAALPIRRAAAARLAPDAWPVASRHVPVLSHAPGGRIRKGLIIYDGGRSED